MYCPIVRNIPRIRGIYIYITTTNIITMKESYQKYPKNRVPFASSALYIRRRVIIRTLADIFYEPTIAMLNEFQSVACWT